MNVKVIAEIGINHDGSLDKAIHLIDIAHKSGCDYVKFQKRTPEICVPLDQWNKPKLTPWGEETTYIDYRRKMEFSKKQFRKINDYCKNMGIGWFASVFDVPSVDFFDDFDDMPYIKIPSAKLTDDELIQKCVKTEIPLILSTGMSTKEQIEHALSLIPQWYDFSLMSCTSTYPCPDDEVNLKRIKTLKRYTDNVGYSHHSVSPYPAIYSVLYGAKFVEFHLTHNRASIGSDHAASQEEKGADLIVREIRKLKALEGDGEIRVFDGEVPAMLKLRGF